MKCAYCGKNNKAGALVCKRCGIALPLPPPENQSQTTTELQKTVEPASGGSTGTSFAEPSKKSGKKLSKKAGLVIALLIICVAAAAVISLVVVINSGNIVLPAVNGYVSYNDAVFYNGEQVIPDESGTVGGMIDLNGARAAVLTLSGNLYSCSKGENKLAAKKVESFCVSVDGRHIVYTDENDLLWSFDCKDSESAPVCICNNAVKTGYAVSPDGKSVLFAKATDSTLYAFIDGKLRTLEEGHVPVSISNGGKHIYSYCEADNSIYYFNARGKMAFVRSNLGTDIFLNSKHDEIVFSTNSGNGIIQTMISVRGGEAVELCNSDSAVYPVLPAYSITVPSAIEYFAIATCPFKTFDGKVFAGSKLVSYSKKTGAAELDNDHADHACASSNYKTVFYVANNKLLKRNISGSEPAQTVAGDCESFIISSNGKIVWYVDLGGVLHCVNGTNDNTIAVGVEKYRPTMNGKNAVFVCSGALYMNKGGRPGSTYSCGGYLAEDLLVAANDLFFRSEQNGWMKAETMGKSMDLSK